MARQMERNPSEDILASILQGGIQGFSAGRKDEMDIRKEIWKERIKQQLMPRKYEPTTQEEALEFERAKAGIVKPNQALQERKSLLQIKDLEQKQKDVEAQSKFASQEVIDTAQDALNTIAEVKNGLQYFGAGALIPPIPTLQPEKIKWRANLDKLLSGRVIDVMTTMKKASKTGATGFGQLSNKELQVLREASTALKRTLSPNDAKEILDNMENKLKKVAGMSSEEQSFNTPEEADNSGLPVGTIVMVGGRRYQI